MRLEKSHKDKVADCEDSCHGPVDNHLVTPLDSQYSANNLRFFNTVTCDLRRSCEIQATYYDSNYLMQIAAAQYQVSNSSGIVIDWTNMTPKDGVFNYASEVVNATIRYYQS